MVTQTVTCPNCKHEFAVPVEKKSQANDQMLTEIEHQIDCLEKAIVMKEKELCIHANKLKSLEDHIHEKNINNLTMESKRSKTESEKRPDKTTDMKLKSLESELMAHKMEIERAQVIRSELIDLNAKLDNDKAKMASMTQFLYAGHKKKN